MRKHISTRAAKTIIAAVISASCIGAVTAPCIAATAAHAATTTTISAAAPADGTTPTPDGPVSNPWG
jgi:hypothetical protein